MRVGFIGTGEITAAMVRGLQGQGHTILVSPRNAVTAATLAELPGVSIAPNEDVVANSDVVFLCLLARVAKDVLSGLPFRANHSIISVMVDAPLARLQTWCAPATDISITIPLPPIAVGGCPLPVYPPSPALNQLFGDRNLVIPLNDEAALAAHMGASALCATQLDQIMTAADWLAGFTGNPDTAEAYVAAMIRAYLPDRPRGGELPQALRMLSTEGGFNATLRARMARSRDELRVALDGFRKRLGLPEKDE